MSRIALIDLSGVFRRFWHAMENDEVSAAHRRTVQAVQGYANGFDHIGVCVDRPPYRRKEILPEYKANREKVSSVLVETIRAIEAELDAQGFHLFGSQGDEADDVIATLTEWAVEHGHDVEVFSADKDLLQLVRDGVTVTSTATGDKHDSAKVQSKFGVPPELVCDLLALIGDKSDNIPGINGVGVKTAAKWLNEHGSLGSMLAKPELIEPARFRPAFEDVDQRQALGSSWRCVLLRTDCPIECEQILTRKLPKPQKEEHTMPELPEDKEPEPTVEHPPDEPTAAPVTALVATTDAPPWERALEPRTPAQAFSLAGTMFESRAFDYPSKAAALAVIMTGRSLGVDSMASLRGFHNIKGKITLSAQLMVGLIKRHPVCEYFRFVEGDDIRATWETKRIGEPEPTRMTYTIEQAKRAGLAGRGQWATRPETMMRWRCSTELGRVVYPDIVSGLYTPEELEEVEEHTIRSKAV